MTSLDKILPRITVLYYIFIVVILLDFAYGFATGFLDGFEHGRQNAEALATFNHSELVVMTIWSMLTIAVYIWALVLFVLLLVSLGRSIATKNIFNPRTPKLINRYATIYAASLVSMFVGQFVISTSPHMLHEGITTLLSSASTIVMLLLFAQVLKIGIILKAETDLTI